ncbi:hypothetical protein OESDEN_05209 [Oesophagostomum dentatum]|uniref:Uncharacterized protein n=1 Tax=Oesophagostomum dentatum TaxID=61180 RepID=A0A0B1TBB2_OESDE|nr:hypothetical protein OESDEN_05209 [Oesophagostomum dentatum]
MDIALYDAMFPKKKADAAHTYTSLLRASVSFNRTCDDVLIPLNLCLCMVQNVHQTKRYPR